MGNILSVPSLSGSQGQILFLKTGRITHRMFRGESESIQEPGRPVPSINCPAFRVFLNLFPIESIQNIEEAGIR